MLSGKMAWTGSILVTGPESESGVLRDQQSNKFRQKDKRNSALGPQYPEFKGQRDHMGPVARPRLQPDVFDVALDGARRDVDFLRDLLGRKALGNKLEHLLLACGQKRDAAHRI
jgi:hypothetical protein